MLLTLTKICGIYSQYKSKWIWLSEGIEFYRNVLKS